MNQATRRNAAILLLIGGAIVGVQIFRSLRSGHGPALDIGTTVYGIAISPGGQHAVVAGNKSDVVFVTLSESVLHVSSRQMIGSRSGSQLLAFGPTSPLVAVGSRSKEGIEAPHVYLFDLTDGRPIAKIEAGGRELTGLAFSSDGSALLIAAETGTEDYPGPGEISIWQTSSWTEAGDAVDLPIAPVCLAVDRSGRYFAAGNYGGTLDVFHDSDRSAKASFTHNWGSLADLDFSADGELLAAAGDRGVEIFNVETGKVVAEVKEYKRCFAVAFLSKPSPSVVFTSDQGLRVLDVGRRLLVREDFSGMDASHLAVDAGGTRLLVGKDRFVTLLSVPSR